MHQCLQKLKEIERDGDLECGDGFRNGKGFIMAAQDQAIRTNVIKARIDKTYSDSKCRLCKVKEETIDHLMSICSKIAQIDYKERDDKVASVLHWNLCRKYNLLTADKWWEHKVNKVLQKENIKILWNFKIQTDKRLAHNIPDITVVEKKRVWIIDVAILGDGRIEEKELERSANTKI